MVADAAAAQEYRRLVLAHRRRELRQAIEPVAQGLRTIIPVAALSFLTGDALNKMCFGEGDISIDDLKDSATYGNGVKATDDHVQFLWRVLEEDFSPEERVDFVRFVSGRTRLPPREKMSLKNNHLRINSHATSSRAQGGRRRCDGFLPASHTCFFTLDLPAYSSQAVLLEKLRYAIANCRAIDNDMALVSVH